MLLRVKFQHERDNTAAFQREILHAKARQLLVDDLGCVKVCFPCADQGFVIILAAGAQAYKQRQYHENKAERFDFFHFLTSFPIGVLTNHWYYIRNAL